MKLKRNNEIIDIEFTQDNTLIKGIVNDSEIAFTILNKEDNNLKLVRNGELIDAYYTEDKDKYYIQILGRQYIFNKVDDEDEIIAGEGHSDDTENIVPPMPGTIIKVNVNEGDTVKEGDAIVVVEAMKMETNLYTRIDGKVTKINVTEGDRVDSETILVTIEKE